VDIYYYHGKIEYLLNELTAIEVKETEHVATLFRGNSLATKALDHFQKLVGTEYLNNTLAPFINAVVADEKHSCEVDPMKLEKQEQANLDKNLAKLKEVINNVTNIIFKSKNSMPMLFRNVYANLVATAAAKWDLKGENEIIKYTVIAGFLFLRFFNPAILGPKQFKLMTTYPPQIPSRNFTLIAKCLQNIANLVPFGQKEPYMLPLNTLIESKFQVMQQFLDFASTKPSEQELQKAHDPKPSIDIQKEVGRLTEILEQKKELVKEKFASDPAYPVFEKILEYLQKHTSNT